MYVVNEIQIHVCWHFVYKGLIPIFSIFTHMIHAFNAHIVKLNGFGIIYLSIQYSIDYEIVKI